MSWYKKIKEKTHGTTYPSGGSNTYGKSRADAGHSFVPKSSDCDCGKSPCDCGEPPAKFTSPKTGAYDAGASGATAPPAKHTEDAKGKAKSKGHLSKHKAGHWGPEGHGDRSFSGIAAKGINAVKEGAEVVGNAATEVGDAVTNAATEVGDAVTTEVNKIKEKTDGTPPAKNLKKGMKKWLKKNVTPKLKFIENVNSAAAAVRRASK